MKQYISTSKVVVLSTKIANPLASEAGQPSQLTHDIHVGHSPVELDERLPAVKALVKSGKLTEYAAPVAVKKEATVKTAKASAPAPALPPAPEAKKK